ncbi:outer membrane beta-barrel protein [Olleya marilimosa]|uniref:Porin family protein n=1 Tax=Olleya marilimosa TaxID=272164 RepID=A0ABR8LUQ8_9FLAO|nr:OmpW family outer membrane protein [Olleya marilimosa]MBD3863923.1 porin family protein [Olleya marilimosa]MBD3891114.1 porin family protein [Olleya marilimosa]|tara:strand:- start:37761 stop:38399 length:639 start_codon:yes stop_codon:yes gene_type:complete
MKKLLFTAAIAVLGFTSVNAQEEQTFGFTEGDVIVEGNLGFNSENDKNTEIETSAFEFNPKVGYFLSDDLAVGVQLMLDTDKETDGIADTETKTTTIGAGVFARYYFLELGKRFKTYGEFGVGFDSAKTEVEVPGVDVDDFKTNGIGANLGLGLNYFVNENIAINFALTDVLSYRSDKADVDGAESVTSFNGNLNVFNNFFQTAQFGLTWKF